MVSVDLGQVFLRSHPKQNDTNELAGKYRLIAELGQGGMATVYLAVVLGAAGFRRLAVLKILRPEIAMDAEFVQMFFDEARLCARLAHPNIVHTYDVGDEAGEHFIAMEYLDGMSLHAAVARLGRNGGPFKFPMQARVLLEVLEGLRYAHELCDYDGRHLAIVHRDVTPQNIFITYEGQVKLLDFGIAKTTTSSVRTATGVVKGKLTYMSPEQARSEHVDARTDLYAVGVMLWEAVTGRRRIPAGLSEPALFARLLAGEPPESPNAAAHGYPAEIDDIVLKSLAPNPDDRFQSAAEFRDALERALRPLPAVNLRDLGAMLADSFAETRRSIRNVIEEQFRVMDQGAPPSDPKLLPAIAGPNLTTHSASHGGRPTAANHGGRPTTGRGTKIRSEATLVTISEPRYRHSAPARLWVSVAIVTAGILIAVAIASLRLSRSNPNANGAEAATPPMASVEATASSARAIPPPTAPPTASVDVVSSADSPGQVPERPATGESGRRTTAHPRVASNATTPRTSNPSAAASGRETPAVAPATATVAPSVPVRDEPSPLRKPDAKPKVQLERENPWP